MKRFYERILQLTETFYWFFFVLLTAAIAFLCFRCLGIGAIDSWDEARHGISAYEMLRSGNYLVNTFLGEPDYWNVKPPLSFLTVAAGFSIFGYTAVGLRFFSALSYLLTCLCTGLFARRYGKSASLLTMLFLAANYFPFKAHLVRAGDADALYLLLFTLTMLAMLKIQESGRPALASGMRSWLFSGIPDQKLPCRYDCGHWRPVPPADRHAEKNPSPDLGRLSRLLPASDPILGRASLAV